MRIIHSTTPYGPRRRFGARTFLGHGVWFAWWMWAGKHNWYVYVGKER